MNQTQTPPQLNSNQSPYTHPSQPNILQDAYNIDEMNMVISKSLDSSQLCSNKDDIDAINQNSSVDQLNMEMGVNNCKEMSFHSQSDK